MVFMPFCIFAVAICYIDLQILFHRNRSSLNLPPSPPSLPFVGHLHLLKDPIHQTLQKLSQKYGPVITLRFGVKLVVLVSSPSAVEECFTKNDIIFANRPHLLMGKYLGYKFNTMITAPYGEHWRNLRKISLLEVLSTNRLSMSLGIRSDEIKLMLGKLYENSNDGFARVELRSLFQGLVFDILMRMIAGKRDYGKGLVDFEETEQFTDIIREVLEFAGASNPGDFLPVPQWIDYGGFIKRIKRLAKKTDAFLQRLVEERRSGVPNTEDEDNMISLLLSLQESDPEYYTDETIKGLILTLLVAGTDTSSAAMEWAMSLLLNNPNVLDKVKSEIDVEVGQDHLVNELDLPKLQYLQNVILETLLMFPTVPLFLPHMLSQDCKISGFDISCGTMLLVNAWAIHRDPNLWDEPEEFKPERFQTTNAVDQFKLLPFGTGRRGCPGATLGNRMVGLALASLIQCFDWKRIGDEKIDMMEGRGLNMPKHNLLRPCTKHGQSQAKFFDLFNTNVCLKLTKKMDNMFSQEKFSY